MLDKDLDQLFQEVDSDAEVEVLLAGCKSTSAISKPLAHLLTRLVLRLGKRSILEFGAGWSSLVMAAALARGGGGRLTSVEHQPEFCRGPWQAVMQVPKVDAALVVSRLQPRLSRHGLMYRYPDAARRMKARGPYDLLLIDAPPGQFGRDGPMYDAFPLLASGAVIVLDDAARHPERTAVRRWLETFPGLQLAALDVGHGRGTAVLSHSGDKKANVAFQAIAGTFHDRLIQARRSWRPTLWRST